MESTLFRKQLLRKELQVRVLSFPSQGGCMVKVKVIQEMKGYAVVGETGKVSDEWNDKIDGHRLRAVKFKNGGYAVFGDKAFDLTLKVIK